MTAATLLQQYGLSITKSRISLLTVFLEINTPLTVALLLKKKLGFNRITLYRSLRAFVNKGILHVIPSANDEIFYTIKIFKKNSDPFYNSNHPHFVCNTCRLSVCLDATPSPKLELPKGYKMESVEIIVNGKCISCA